MLWMATKVLAVMRERMAWRAEPDQSQGHAALTVL